MAILESLNLSPRERAENGYKLPDELSLYEICDLWKDSKSKSFSIYLKAMHKAYKTGKLNGVFLENYHKPKPDIFGLQDYKIDSATLERVRIAWQGLGLIDDDWLNPDDCKNIVVQKNDFLIWLESQGEPIPTGCLLEIWWSYGKTSELESHPSLKGKVEEIGTKISNSDILRKDSRALNYFKFIFDSYGDKPNAEAFLKRLIADGFENDFQNPKFEREIAPIFKISTTKGIWLTYDEDCKPSDPHYTLRTIQKRCSDGWASSPKKRKGQQ